MIFSFQIRWILTKTTAENVFVVQGKKNRFGKIGKKNLFEAICSVAGIDHLKQKLHIPGQMVWQREWLGQPKSIQPRFIATRAFLRQEKIESDSNIIIITAAS